MDVAAPAPCAVYGLVAALAQGLQVGLIEAMAARGERDDVVNLLGELEAASARAPLALRRASELAGAHPAPRAGRTA